MVLIEEVGPRVGHLTIPCNLILWHHDTKFNTAECSTGSKCQITYCIPVYNKGFDTNIEIMNVKSLIMPPHGV